MRVFIKALKTVGIVFLAMAIFYVASSMVLFAVASLQARQNAKSQKLTNQLTKQDYISLVEKNYDPALGFSLEEMKCVYSSFIDQYGIEETIKVDRAMTLDTGYVDSRLVPIYELCTL